MPFGMKLKFCFMPRRKHKRKPLMETQVDRVSLVGSELSTTSDPRSFSTANLRPESQPCTQKSNAEHELRSTGNPTDSKESLSNNSSINLSEEQDENALNSSVNQFTNDSNSSLDNRYALLSSASVMDFNCKEVQSKLDQVAIDVVTFQSDVGRVKHGNKCVSNCSKSSDRNFRSTSPQAESDIISKDLSGITDTPTEFVNVNEVRLVTGQKMTMGLKLIYPVEYSMEEFCIGATEFKTSSHLTTEQPNPVPVDIIHHSEIINSDSCNSNEECTEVEQKINCISSCADTYNNPEVIYNEEGGKCADDVHPINQIKDEVGILIPHLSEAGQRAVKLFFDHNQSGGDIINEEIRDRTLFNSEKINEILTIILGNFVNEVLLNKNNEQIRDLKENSTYPTECSGDNSTISYDAINKNLSCRMAEQLSIATSTDSEVNRNDSNGINIFKPPYVNQQKARSAKRRRSRNFLINSLNLKSPSTEHQILKLTDSPIPILDRNSRIVSDHYVYTANLHENEDKGTDDSSTKYSTEEHVIGLALVQHDGEARETVREEVYTFENGTNIAVLVDSKDSFEDIGEIMTHPEINNSYQSELSNTDSLNLITFTDYMESEKALITDEVSELLQDIQEQVHRMIFKTFSEAETINESGIRSMVSNSSAEVQINYGDNTEQCITLERMKPSEIQNSYNNENNSAYAPNNVVLFRKEIQSKIESLIKQGVERYCSHVNSINIIKSDANEINSVLPNQDVTDIDIMNGCFKVSDDICSTISFKESMHNFDHNFRDENLDTSKIVWEDELISSDDSDCFQNLDGILSSKSEAMEVTKIPSPNTYSVMQYNLSSDEKEEMHIDSVSSNVRFEVNENLVNLKDSNIDETRASFHASMTENCDTGNENTMSNYHAQEILNSESESFDTNCSIAFTKHSESGDTGHVSNETSRALSPLSETSISQKCDTISDSVKMANPIMEKKSNKYTSVFMNGPKNKVIINLSPRKGEAAIKCKGNIRIVKDQVSRSTQLPSSISIHSAGASRVQKTLPTTKITHDTRPNPTGKSAHRHQDSLFDVNKFEDECSNNLKLFIRYKSEALKPMKRHKRMIPIRPDENFEFTLSSVENKFATCQEPNSRDFHKSKGPRKPKLHICLSPGEGNRHKQASPVSGIETNINNIAQNSDHGYSYPSKNCRANRKRGIHDRSPGSPMYRTPTIRRILNASKAIRSPKYPIIVNHIQSSKNSSDKNTPCRNTFNRPKVNSIQDSKFRSKGHVNAGSFHITPNSKYVVDEQMHLESPTNYANHTKSTRVNSVEDIRPIFDAKFKRYAKAGRTTGDLISFKKSTEWLSDVGIVGNVLTAEEADKLFKEIAGVKIALNKCDYRRFLCKLTKLKRLNYNEIYERLCGPDNELS